MRKLSTKYYQIKVALTETTRLSKIIRGIEWSGIEERVWQQKSRVTWINLGDANTKFFHAFTKDRLSHNAIKSLTTDGGMVLKTQ